MGAVRLHAAPRPPPRPGKAHGSAGDATCGRSAYFGKKLIQMSAPTMPPMIGPTTGIQL